MNVDLSPEQECAVATLDLYNNSTAWQTAEQALETQMVEFVLNTADCANHDTNDDGDGCILDEASTDFTATTAAYTTACIAAGGQVLVEPSVTVTCVDAADNNNINAGSVRYHVSFRNIDICAAPELCTADMVDFLFLGKGRDVLDALLEEAVSANVDLVCYDADDCSFVRSSPGGPPVDVALLPGCPTLEPTLSPTTSGATNGGIMSSHAMSSWLPTLGALVVAWALKKAM